MNLVKEKQGGLVPTGLKRWPIKLIKHFADATGVSPSPAGLVRVFSDVLVAFLYSDSCHYRQSNLAIENPEFSKPVMAGHFQ